MSTSFSKHTKKTMFTFNMQPLNNTPSPESPDKGKNNTLVILHQKREQEQLVLKQIYQPINRPLAKKRNCPKKIQVESPLPKIVESPDKKTPSPFVKKYRTSENPYPTAKIRTSPVKKIEKAQIQLPRRSHTFALKANAPQQNDIREHTLITKEQQYLKAVPIRINKSILVSKKITSSSLHKSTLAVANKHITTMSDFDIVSTLGAGCFGTVKLAKNWRNQPVAIKMVDKEFAIKMSQQKHLLNEKHFMMSLDSIYTLKW